MITNVDYNFQETLTKGKVYAYDDVQIYAKIVNQGPGSLQIVGTDLDQTIASGSEWSGDTSISELTLLPPGS